MPQNIMESQLSLQSADQKYLNQCRSALASEQAKSLAETNNWSHVDKTQVHVDWDLLYKEIAKVVDTVNPSSPAAQKFIARHCEIVSRYYPPKKDAYIGLALFYDENADMKAYHNSYHPKMVEFLGDAIYTYATSNL